MSLKRQSADDTSQRSLQAVAPLPSATVVVARGRRGAPELLLVERHANAPFGASHVFPGGLVEPQDLAVDRRCEGVSAADAGRCLGLEEGALGYYSAAVRELFEETGVLLARDGNGATPLGEPFPEDRERLLKGELAWPLFLEHRGLSLATDRLRYFAWWVTPVARSARFSTRFFLAEMPEGQRARHDGRELTDSFWITAEEALAAGCRGEIRLPPPTCATLRSLAGCTGMGELRTWAARRSEAGVRCILPVIRQIHGREQILLPGEPGYPADGGDAR